MADKSFQQLCVEADADFYRDSLHPIAYVFGGRRVFRQSTKHDQQTTSTNNVGVTPNETNNQHNETTTNSGVT